MPDGSSPEYPLFSRFTLISPIFFRLKTKFPMEYSNSVIELGPSPRKMVNFSLWPKLFRRNTDSNTLLSLFKERTTIQAAWSNFRNMFQAQNQISYGIFKQCHWKWPQSQNSQIKNIFKVQKTKFTMEYSNSVIESGPSHRKMADGAWISGRKKIPRRAIFSRKLHSFAPAIIFV